MDDRSVGLGGAQRLARVLIVAGVLVAVALPWQAAAQIPTPVGEIPVPTTLPPVLGGGDGGGGGLTPPPVTNQPTTPTTAPSPQAPPTTAASEQPRAGTVTTPAPTSVRSPARSTGRAGSSRAGDVAPVDDTLLVERADGAPQRPAIARLREVSVPAARQFGFPLVLGFLVLGFLVVQARLDARDPKLAAAPVTVDDDLLPFL